LAGLAACQTGSPTEEGMGRGVEQVTLPSQRAYTGVTPDLAGDGFALPNAFFSYPEVNSGDILPPPGDGEKVRIACGVGGPTPPALGQNSYWQGLNQRIGSELDYQMVPEADYGPRAATLLAGGGLPDIMQIPQRMAKLPSILEARFTDLTEHLSGDKILDYPYLANLPTYVWEQSTFRGGIYGVMRPLHLYGSFMFARNDMLAAAGATVGDIGNGEDFIDLCRELTQQSANRWAAADPSWMVWFLTEMMGKPYYSQLKWHEEGGSFTHSHETEEYRLAVETVAGMMKEGLFHPDAGALNGNEVIAQFVAGRIALDYRGGAQWSTRITQDGLDIDVIPPVAWQGGGLGVKALGTGTYTLAAISKDVAPERVPTLLSVMNWLAAPFGTPEHLYLQFGVEGEHHTRTAQTVERTETGKNLIGLPNSYVAAPPPELHVAGHPDITRAMYDYIKTVIPNSLQDAALGLWSETDNSEGPTIDRALSDTTTAVLRGQKTMGDFDAALDEWRGAGGDTIRHEYEAAFAEAHG